MAVFTQEFKNSFRAAARQVGYRIITGLGVALTLETTFKCLDGLSTLPFVSPGIFSTKLDGLTCLSGAALSGTIVSMLVVRTIVGPKKPSNESNKTGSVPSSEVPAP